MPHFYMPCLLVFLCCWALPAFAQSKAVPLPPEMLFEREPIDPECVYAADAFEGGRIPQDLSVCMKERPAAIAYKSRSDLNVRENGARGYDYGKNDNPEDRDETLERSYTGYFYYRYIGKKENKLILMTSYSGGGSGHFMYLSEYAREGNIFRHVRNISVGDRCNRGLVSAEMEDNSLRYTYVATSADLFYALVPEEKRYPRQLNSAPIDCAAKVFMRDAAIEKIELTAVGDDFSRLGSDCFKQLYTEARDRHQGVLTAAQGKTLMTHFVAECGIE